MNPKLKVVLYTRISTEEQEHEPQLRELYEQAARNGWAVVGEYSDTISGTKSKRPQLDRMLAELKDRGAQAIVAAKLDRIGRSTLHIAQLTARLDEQGVALICQGQGIDTRKDCPVGRLQIAILSSVAQFERDLIRERTLAGLRVARANGKKLGRPSPKLVPNSAEVVAKWMAEPAATVRELAKRLGGVSVSFAWRLGKGKKKAALVAMGVMR